MSLSLLSSSEIRVLAYDIDGCVFSSEEILHKAYQEAIRAFPNPRKVPLTIPSLERILLEVGKPVKTIFENLLPDLFEEERDEISKKVLDELCLSIEKGEGHFYPEISKSLQELKSMGFVLVAASNGREPYVRTILSKINCIHLFEPIVTLDNKIRKTKGDILLHYQEHMKLSPKHFLMIGDRFSDYEAALKANSPFAFCKYGHAEPNEIPEYSVILENPYQLVEFLKENGRDRR